MAASNFTRGLFSDLARSRVKEFFDTPVGRRIKVDADYRVCLRDNYINVYYRGCSVIKYDPLAGAAGTFSIHSKYLSDNGTSEYIIMTEKDGDLVADRDGATVSFTRQVMENSRNRVKRDVVGEKRYLAEYIWSQKPFLLDLEVAFTRERSASERIGGVKASVANRIDMAVIAENLTLKFVEVKIDTDSRLRSKEDGNQEVLVQMAYYRDFLREELKAIRSSYRQVAADYLYLDLACAFPEIGNLCPQEVLERIANCLEVDQDPCLLVINTGKSFKGRRQAGKEVDHVVRLNNQLIKGCYMPYLEWITPKPAG